MGILTPQHLNVHPALNMKDLNNFKKKLASGFSLERERERENGLLFILNMF